MKTINLNSRIRVRLTPHGIKMFAAYYQHLFRDIDPEFAREFTPELGGENQDMYESELWDFMLVFGACLYNGCDMVTQGTDLEIVSPES